MAENQHILALSEESLMSVAYDEETLSESEREHLEHCVFCQQQVAQYRRMNALLRAKFYRFQCPSSVELNYYCLGVLSDEDWKRINTHILDCLSCAGELEDIQQSQADFEASLPPTPTSPAPHALRRLIATYVVRPLAEPVLSEENTFVLRKDAPLILRDEASGKEWPRQYKAESIDLSLHLSHTPNGEIMLIGIITSSRPGAKVDDYKGSQVYLYYAPGPLSIASQDAETADPLLSAGVDGGGTLTLEPVPPGSFVMLIRLPEQEIITGEFTINQE